MQKHNLLVKKLKKQILSINDSIESYFNKLKNFNIKSIKAKFDQDYKLFWGIGAFVILTISYFLAPTAYDKPKSIIRLNFEELDKKVRNYFYIINRKSFRQRNFTNIFKRIEIHIYHLLDGKKLVKVNLKTKIFGLNQ